MRQRLKLSKKSQFNLKNSQGFSLLEVLIAIVILSFLMLSIFQIIDNSSATNYRIQTEDRALLQFDSALNIMQTDIEYMFTPLFFETTKKLDEAAYKKAFATAPTTEQDSYSQDPYQESTNNTLSKLYLEYSASNLPIPKFFNESKTSIAFLTSAGRRLVKNTKQSNFYWVVYELRDNPEPINENAPYILTRATLREDIYGQNIDLTDLKPYPILDNIKSLEFKFWHRDSKKFVDSSRLLEQDEHTPRLIRVELEVEGPNGDILETKRTFRPLFPVLDTKEMLKKKYTKDKSTGPTGGISGGTSPEGSSSEEDGEFE